MFSNQESAQKPEAGPLNPDYLKYLERIEKGEHRLYTDDGYPLGFTPPSVDLSHVRGVLDNNVEVSYPTKFDLRTKGKLTSVRDQGNCGSCWIFASYASLESCLLPSERRNFSEQHLNVNHGFNRPECEGGNAYRSAAYMLRWSGPIYESDMPYPYRLSGIGAYSTKKHIQQVIFLPGRTGYRDNDTIKYFVTNYGAVKCSYYVRTFYYNSNTHSYYNYSNSDTNHAVAIVGWDDNYNKSNFKNSPPGNGAFIVKNSWGSDYGENGYFYLSYYDKSLQKFVCFNNAEASNNYDNNYQYDPFGWTRNYGYNYSRVAWAANIFTAVDKKSLRAVGFYTNDSNVQYKVYIYRGVISGKPRSGTLAASISGSKTYPGFYTIKLDSNVSLKKREKFSVVIRLKNSNYNYPIAVEHPNYNRASFATANLGESYMDADGRGTWYDMAKGGSNTNVCIKAFTGGRIVDGNPKISCNRTKLNFGCVVGGSYTGAQDLCIRNSGSGSLRWEISCSKSWLKFSPSSGTNSKTVRVSLNTAGLTPGSYTANVYVSDPYASNSPRKVTVNLKVISGYQAQGPFGDFATPVHGSKAMGSIPVTGWVLDDIGISSVKIYSGNTYVGEAVFIEGARPDVETSYPTHPMNFKAGWGYMLLTNYLPGGGNGTYVLKAKATDKEGHVVTLGSKVIYCDNANAVKPFGAIDTPSPGGSASGKEFKNYGWVITPLPNTIPKNGKTIDVVVDGVKIGHPYYNMYREDIANFFPGFNNSGGAAGYYNLDTTEYDNGIHTIQWIVEDNANNIDGIGSRFFSVDNGGNRLQKANREENIYRNNSEYNSSMKKWDSQWRAEIDSIPVEVHEPIRYKIGYEDKGELNTCTVDENHLYRMTIREDERLAIYFSQTDIEIQNQHQLPIELSEMDDFETNRDETLITGYQIVGERLTSLPIGSTMNSKEGVFYWQPGPGFVGEYSFVFMTKNGSGEMLKRELRVMIIPKFGNQ
jgi:C1A family cysteine protease